MKHRIVVLGAGYTGTSAAGRLARSLHRDDVEITLVNADTEFVERVRMHQLATGQRLKSRPLTAILAGTGVKVRTAWVTAIDPDAKTVAVEEAGGPAEIAYDTLVYALGSAVADHGVPGVAEHAHNVAGKGSALRLRDRLAALPAGATVLVAGGGLTGIESVTEIAESRPDLDVALVTRGELGDWLGEKGREHLRAVLGRLGVTVHEHTDITSVSASAVTTGDGGDIPAEVTVWTTGFAVHPIAAASTLAVAPNGRIIVDASVRSVSHPDVYAVGDAAHAEGAGGKTLRMSCASGIPLSWHAADVITARLTGGEVPTTTIGYSQQCVSLGRRDALIQKVHEDDTAKPEAMTGRFAARYKELICRGAAWGTAHPTLLLPRRRRRVVVDRARSDAAR
ncbi:FAD-dependent oxidoreductase [Phytomonospora sp. NPDC050363]|uniref:NAD(P)/FAD-dependent oxidoreductase n=1 Tax=Phytomonospora sp. NPDC050363 TaxID=3155642 RepID=UPI0033FB788B